VAGVGAKRYARQPPVPEACGPSLEPDKPFGLVSAEQTYALRLSLVAATRPLMT